MSALLCPVSLQGLSVGGASPLQGFREALPVRCMPGRPADAAFRLRRRLPAESGSPADPPQRREACAGRQKGATLCRRSCAGRQAGWRVRRQRPGSAGPAPGWRWAGRRQAAGAGKSPQRRLARQARRGPPAPPSPVLCGKPVSLRICLPWRDLPAPWEPCWTN